MNRRTLAAALGAGLLLLPAAFGSAAPARQDAKIRLLQDLGDALDASGALFADLGAYLDAAAGGRAFGDSDIAQLRDLLGQIDALSYAQTTLLGSLSDYPEVARADPEGAAPAHWQGVLSQIGTVLVLVDSTRRMVADNAALRDEIGQAPLQTLSRLMSTRVTLLQQLGALDTPTSEEELAVIENLNARYERAAAALRQLRDRIAGVVAA